MITQDIAYSDTGYNTTKIGCNNEYSRLVFVAPKGLWVQDKDGNVSPLSTGGGGGTSTNNFVIKYGVYSQVTLTQEDLNKIFKQGMPLILKNGDRYSQYVGFRYNEADHTGLLVTMELGTPSSGEKLITSTYTLEAVEGGYKLKFHS